MRRSKGRPGGGPRWIGLLLILTILLSGCAGRAARNNPAHVPCPAPELIEWSEAFYAELARDIGHLYAEHRAAYLAIREWAMFREQIEACRAGGDER